MHPTVQPHPLVQMPKFTNAVNAVTEIAVSYNSRYLALCTDVGTIWLGTTDMQVRA